MKRFRLVATGAMLVAPLFLFAPAAVAAQALTTDQEARITEVFSDLDAPESPGASVAIIRGGEIIYSRGFGSAQLEYGLPITPETVFHVASVSKQFTAMAVLLLAAEGKLDLDDDIRTHMPEVPDMGGLVTPRHLLQHTSGVRDQWQLLAMAGWRMDDVITKEHVRRLLSKQEELNFEPGTRYLYSNMGFSLAADLVERVSGMPFQDFVGERIFQPLGMGATHVHDDHRHVVPNRAYSYATRPGGGFEKRVLSFANHGATSLFTTAEDLVAWLDNFRTVEVGNPESHRAMQTRAVLTDGDTVGYGLGLSVGPFRGVPRVGHGGSDAGFRSNVSWFPEQELGIVVLSKLATGNPALRDMRITMILLEDELGAPPAPAGETASGESGEVQLSQSDLEALEGRFASPIGVVELEVREGALWATSPDTVRLTATSSTTFQAEDFPMSLTFHVGEAADSITLVQRQSGIEIMARREAVSPEFGDYAGHYYSPEIETIYEIRQIEGELAVYNLKLGEIPLTSAGRADAFFTQVFPLGSMQFFRDDSGAVAGFRATRGRVLNLRFMKMDGGLPR